MPVLPKWPYIAIAFLAGMSAGIALRSFMLLDSNAGTSALSVFASLILVGITYLYVQFTSRYVETNEQSLKLMREEWESQRAVRPNFWLQRSTSAPVLAFDVPVGGERRSWSFERIGVMVWNFGQQSFKVTGMQVRRTDREEERFRRSFLLPDQVIQPHDSQFIDIAFHLYSTITGSTADGRLPALPETSDVEVRLKYTSWERE